MDDEARHDHGLAASFESLRAGRRRAAGGIRAGDERLPDAFGAGEEEARGEGPVLQGSSRRRREICHGESGGSAAPGLARLRDGDFRNAQASCDRNPCSGYRATRLFEFRRVCLAGEHAIARSSSFLKSA